MKIFYYFVLTILFSLLSYSVNANNYKIMFLGDSITEGSVGPHYRCFLLNMLKSTGHQFDAVGSKNSNDPNCDADHEGHSGWRTDNVLEHVTTWAPLYNPDMVLIHLGTNDLWQGNNIESTVVELSELVYIFQTNNPNIVIFIAGIIPMYIEDRNQAVMEVNSIMKDYAQHASTTTSQVFFVDHHSNYGPEFLPDGVHPNASGATEMALRWFEAMKEYFRQNRL